MRQIQMITLALARALFRKDTVEFVRNEESRFTKADHAALNIEDLLAQGQLGAAEDQLFALLEADGAHDTRILELALAFYARLNAFDDDYLLAHHFPREEIQQGLDDCMARFDVSV